VTLLDDLHSAVGDRVTDGLSQRELHGRDESALPEQLPDLVVAARSTEEVAAVLRACRAVGAPVIAFGAGSSLEGHVLATRGGVSLDLSAMDRILRVSETDLDADVEAGVRKDQLNGVARERGLFFAVDPGADATIGGMAATGASGTMTVRYGTIRENVLAMTAVLADGTVIRTGSRARKSAAGYDLRGLLLGSEGTLAIITELTVRLHGIPERIAAASSAFPAIAGAVDAATALVQLGVPVARCEFLDAATVAAVNAHSLRDDPELPTLFLEFHGAPASVDEQIETTRQVVSEHGGSPLRFAHRPDERSAIWDARHTAFFAIRASRPGCRAISTDACVPVSVLAACIEATAAEIPALGIPPPGWRCARSSSAAASPASTASGSTSAATSSASTAPRPSRRCG
jgi:D-lactate dehydrogenase (cytochrome)